MLNYLKSNAGQLIYNFQLFDLFFDCKTSNEPESGIRVGLFLSGIIRQVFCTNINEDNLKEGTDTKLGNLRSLKDQTNREIVNFTFGSSLHIN
jgi:hypothetical protein